MIRKSPPSVGVRSVRKVDAVEGTSRDDRALNSDAPRGFLKLLRSGTPASRYGEQQHRQDDQARGLYALLHRKQHVRKPSRPGLEPMSQHFNPQGAGPKWDGLRRQRKADLDELFEPGTYIFTTQAQLLEDLTMLALHVATLLDNTAVPPLSRSRDSRSLSGRDKEAKLMYELRSRCLGVVLRLSEKGYTDRAKRLQDTVNSAVMSSDFLLLPDSTIVPNAERCNIAQQLDYGGMLRHWIAVELERVPAAPEAERTASTTAQPELETEQRDAARHSATSRLVLSETSQLAAAETRQRKLEEALRIFDDIAARKTYQSEIDASGLFESHKYIYVDRAQFLVDLALVYLHVVSLSERDLGASTLSIAAAASNIDGLILHLLTYGHTGAASKLATTRYSAMEQVPLLPGAKSPLMINSRRSSTQLGRKVYARALSEQIKIESIRLFGPGYARQIAAGELKRQNQEAMEALVAAGEFRENPFRAAKQEKDVWADQPMVPSTNKYPASGNLVEVTDDPLQGLSKGKGRALPPISEIDWAEVPEDEVQRLVSAYNDSPSPADSGVSFSHAEEVHAQAHYKGKGKGRATERKSAGMTGAFPSSPSNVQSPADGTSADGTSLDSWTDVSKDSGNPDLFHLPWESLTDRHTKALQDAHVAQELTQRLEHDARLERELMEVEDARVAARVAEEESAAAAEAARVKAAASLLRSCVVCGDDKLPFLFPSSSVSTSCTHEILTCKECLQAWLTSELDSKGTESIKCPECPSVLTPEDFLRCAPLDLAQKFDRLLTRATLSALPGFAWCLASECDSGQVNVENSSYMKCAACSHEVCLSCKVKWHQGKTCAEYGVIVRGDSKRRREEEKSEKMVQGMSKVCPGTGCGARIEKGGGCDHMTCRKCRWEFCWQCLASQKDIKRIGNTAHERDCKFHSENLDVAWPFNAH
ncbi:hypothetical protein B0A48_06770 [Cryoendolithus antarcticus]|uniref:RBR-type E3 ubiquitin transferase n=1 Tax=Cryoendolithus antarcticus TaxID=1507870 RepID=A0A1V8T993_9PEZI|nr:hypothetical protein B0A48_06770 [Cryoendolithus antarcticus]